MTYILSGHAFVNEIQTMTQVFYPNEKFTRVDEVSAAGFTAVSELIGERCVSRLYCDGELLAAHELQSTGDVKHGVKKSMFLCLRSAGGYTPDWGMLTGIRPSKLVHTLWAQGLDNTAVAKVFADEYFVNADKTALCLRVAEAERRSIIETTTGGYSLYVGVPFCPSRCLYCSFTSYPIGQHNADAYLTALEKEIAAFARVSPPDTIYIGGGTPTALGVSQLDRLLRALADAFPSPREFTVEAGRPDTIDREKLRLLKDYGVNRLSINPQTMNDQTLERIGRRHTRADFLNAFADARAEGHQNINVDLILGLPGEDTADVRATFGQVLALGPENLTVHTLSVKRASLLKTENLLSWLHADEIGGMLAFSQAAAQSAGFAPYYMYRQKNMLGNFENLGYTRPGFDCLYNVQIMAEVQSILALGCGGVTKTYDPATSRIERFFNVKSVDAYIARIDETIERKTKGVIQI